MLSDRFGRLIDYLRISVTDRCDLRCSYCLPKGFKGFEEPRHWLTFDEIERVVAAFARLGTSRFRLTGGEPLLRRHVSELARRLAQISGVQDLSLSTNATQLSQHAADLRAAGVHRINVSLDSLRRDCMHQLTGRDCLAQVLAGLARASEVGFDRIKINMVPIQGVNDIDLESMIAFCIERGFVLRLIESMPMGVTGQNTQGLDLQKWLTEWQPRFGLQPVAMSMGGGPARYWQTSDGRFTLGLITPISQHFCATCNRVRLSVDGTLYLCLGQESSVPLRPMLRAGCSDTELDATIRAAIERKPERHEFQAQPQQILRFMSMTGG